MTAAVALIFVNVNYNFCCAQTCSTHKTCFHMRGTIGGAPRWLEPGLGGSLGDRFSGQEGLAVPKHVSVSINTHYPTWGQGGCLLGQGKELWEARTKRGKREGKRQGGSSEEEEPKGGRAPEGK